MARVLIVGGAGYVGSHCTLALAASGHDCVVYDNLFRGHREFVQWGPLIEGDVRDEAHLCRVLTEHAIDAVLHFAALAYVGESTLDPGTYWDVNVNGTRCLLSAMHQCGVRKLVFSSTCAVYGQPEQVPITETTPLQPMNPYGQSKLACERMMQDFDAAHGLRSARLRYFNAAGADSQGRLWEWHTPETHLIPLILDAAFGRRKQIEVFGTDFPTPDGTAIRDYVHVADLASAHRLALEHLLAGGSSLAVNLGTGTGTSVVEMIRAVETVCARPVPHVFMPRRDGDPAELVASALQAHSLLGWTAQRTILDIVRDAALRHTLTDCPSP